MTPVRFSALKWMARSPAHYRYYSDHGMEQTLSMRLGSGAHALLLGQPYIVFTGKVRNGKKWDAFEAEHADKVILNQKEYDQAARMVDAIMAHSDARQLIFSGSPAIEQTVHWLSLGRGRSGTPDVRGSARIVELKTGKTTDPDKFTRDGTWRYYHAQLADYLDGVALSGLGKPTEAYIVAVESTPPHCVTVMRLTDRAIDQGRRLCRIWLERVLGCERDGRWPGYVESIVPFDVDAPLELEGLDDEDGEVPVHGFDDDEPDSLLNALKRSMTA